MKHSGQELITWLRGKMDEREWNAERLSRESGVSVPQIWKVLSGKIGAGVDFCNKMAVTFDVSPVTVFRTAGLLPDGMPDDLAFEDYKYVLYQLDEKDRDELHRIALLKLDQKRKEDEKSPNPNAQAAYN